MSDTQVEEKWRGKHQGHGSLAEGCMYIIYAYAYIA